MTIEDWLTTPERAEQLRAAFCTVAPKNWKSRINKKLWLTPAELDDVLEAIIFVAGCSADAWPIDDTEKDGRKRYQISAAGYYASVGA